MKTQKLTYLMLTVAASAGVIAPAQAQDLRAPFELETARVLPVGVRNPRFKSIFTSIDERFGSSGQVLPLGDKLNKRVSWSDVINAQSSKEEQNLVRASLKNAAVANPDADFSDSGSPGSTTGDVHVFSQVMIPVFAIGLTERFTLGVAAPVYRFDVKADTGFNASAEGQAFVNTVSQSSYQKGIEAAQKLNRAVDQKLARLGYEPIQSRQFSALGDARVVGKYLLHSASDLQVAAKGELTAATGRVASADEPLPISAGDGQWDVGTAVIADYTLLPGLRLNALAGYTVQLPDTRERRLPTSATDSLSADKEMVTRNLGDVITAGGSLNFDVGSTGITLGSGYLFQSLGKTSINGGQGGKFALERYQYLEELFPAQTLHSGILSAGVSTVEFYKQKRFPIPVQANLNYSIPFAGKNAPSNRMLMGEFVMFL